MIGGCVRRLKSRLDKPKLSRRRTAIVSRALRTGALNVAEVAQASTKFLTQRAREIGQSKTGREVIFHTFVGGIYCFLRQLSLSFESDCHLS